VDPSFVIIGMNLRSAPSELWERFLLTPQACAKAMTTLARAEGVEEVVVLSACWRTEFIVWASDVGRAADSVLNYLAQNLELKQTEWQHFYRMLDEPALVHLMREIAGTDGIPNEEADPVAATRTAWLHAREVGTCHRMLDTIFSRGLAAAARVIDIAQDSADQILLEESRSLRKALVSEQVVPAMVALKSRLEEICRQELQLFRNEAGPFNGEQERAFQAMTSRVLHRISCTVAQELQYGTPNTQQMAAGLHRLFHLSQVRSAMIKSEN